MKKIVRLTESDLVRIINKVLNENPADISKIIGNSVVKVLKVNQWKPEIEATYANGYKQIKRVKATISKGGFDIMKDKDVNMYDIYTTGDGGIEAKVVTGDCRKVGTPACLTTVKLNKSESESLIGNMKDFKPYTITKNVEADVPFYGKTNVQITLTIG